MVAKKSPAIIAKEAERCYELAAAGMSTRAIAEEMGFSQSVVVRRMRAHIKEHEHRKLDQWRDMQMTDLMNLRRRLQKQVESGDIKAIGQAVRIWERIARMLGTDAATAFKVETQEVSPFTNRMGQLTVLGQLFEQAGVDASDIDQQKAEIQKAHDERKALPPRKKRPTPEWFLEKERKEAEARERAKNRPADEFAPEPDAGEPIEPELEEFEPAPRPHKRRRGQPIPNPAAQFLTDSDDD